MVKKESAPLEVGRFNVLAEIQDLLDPKGKIFPLTDSIG